MKALDDIRAELDRRAATIERLTAENGALRSQIHIMTDGAVDLLRDVLGIARGDAEFLRALRSANGRLLTFDQIDDAMPGRAAGRDISGVARVRASRLGRVLGREAIVNHHGKGYSLSAAGMAKCDAVLGRSEEHA